MSPLALFKRILEFNLPFDQLIFEGGRESAWVHISYSTTTRRGTVLQATFPAAGGVEYAMLSPDQARGLVA
jgi:hypothetical protein